MTIVVNGSGTITGISQGGLNDNIITQSELANTGVAGNGPAFSAYLPTNQTISSTTPTKVVLSSKSFDTNGNFDNATNYRFTPTVAGYYQFNGSVALGSPGSGSTALVASIRKNNIEASYAYVQLVTGSLGLSAVCTSCFLYMNGSTDYVELYGQINAPSGSIQIDSGSKLTYLQGFLARAA